MRNKKNAIGLDINGIVSAYNNSVAFNKFELNNIGIKNGRSTNNIYCNKIYDNLTYDFYNNIAFGDNIDISNNYWCSTDSNFISGKIFDGFDNINFGLTNFMPFDTSECYLITGLNENGTKNFSFSIFPNPADDKITIILPMNNLQTEVKIYNLIGHLVFISKIENTSTELNILEMTNGIYIIELIMDGTIIRKKFCKQ